MDQYLPLITGGAGALVVLSLWVFAFYSGKIHADSEFSKLEAENDYWKAAYSRLVETVQTERRIVNETAQAGQVNNQLLNAFVSLASGHTTVPQPGLTAEDLGLKQ